MPSPPPSGALFLPGEGRPLPRTDQVVALLCADYGDEYVTWLAVTILARYLGLDSTGLGLGGAVEWLTDRGIRPQEATAILADQMRQLELAMIADLGIRRHGNQPARPRVPRRCGPRRGTPRDGEAT